MEKDTKDKSSTLNWWQTQIGCFDKTVHKDSAVIQTPVESKETKKSNSEIKLIQKN